MGGEGRATGGRWLLAGAVVRTRWASVLTIVFLTALTVAVGGGGVAAAKRTITAHPRLLDRIETADASYGVGNPDAPEYGYVEPADIAPLDVIETMGVARGTLGGLVDPEGHLVQPDREEPATELFVALDDHVYRDVAELPMEEGRLPRSDEASAVAISTGVRDHLGLGLGDEIRYALVRFEDIEAIVESGLSTYVVPHVSDLRVVGVFGPTDLGGPPDDLAGQRWMIGSRALLDENPGAGTWLQVNLKLRGGEAGLAELREEITPLIGDAPGTRTQGKEAVRRAVGPEAVAVLLFGLIALAVGALMTAQAVGRLCAATSADMAVVAALGMPRRGRAQAVGLPPAIAVGLGATIGVAAAAAGSVLAPVGVARAFEPHPGTRLDLVPVVAAGLAVAVLWSAVAVYAWHHSRPGRAAAPGRASRWGGPLELRLARSLSAATPAARRLAGAAVAAATVCVITLVGVLTFGASLHRLVTTPSYYGSDFDVSVWDGYGVQDDDVITAALAEQSAVSAISRPLAATGTVEGREAALAGFDPPLVGPVLTSGRWPRSDDEVVLGRRLASDVDAAIGDDVTIEVVGTTKTYRVVGTGVLPDGGGDAALFSEIGLLRVAPDAEVGWQYARAEDGADVPGLVSDVLRRFDDCAVDCDVVRPSPPAEVRHLDRVGNLPVLLAGLLAVFGVATMVNALVLVARSNRRSLALLRAIGATRGLVDRSVVAQVSLICAAALAAGLPLGWIAGGLLWRRLADSLGVVPTPTVSLLAIGGVVAGLVVVSHAVALGPARRASRLSPAPDLGLEG